MNVTRKKVFISYCHADPEIAIFIRNKIEPRLHASDIDALWDQNTHEHSQGDDIYEFQDRMADPEITHILMICDINYVAKIEARKGNVYSEFQLIRIILAENRPQKVIPLLVKPTSHDNLPFRICNLYHETVNLDAYDYHGLDNIVDTISQKPIKDSNMDPNMSLMESPLSKGLLAYLIANCSGLEVDFEPETKELPFDDVKNSDFFAPSILAVWKHNIIGSDNTEPRSNFSPNRLVTYDETIRALIRAYDLPLVEALDVEFSDLEKGSSDEEYVATAYCWSIIDLPQGESIGLKNYVTIGQLLLMLKKAPEPRLREN